MKEIPQRAIEQLLKDVEQCFDGRSILPKCEQEKKQARRKEKQIQAEKEKILADPYHVAVTKPCQVHGETLQLSFCFVTGREEPLAR